MKRHPLLPCAALVLAAGLQAQQPSATFNAFNDWLTAEARGVSVGADGRLRLAPALRRVAQLPEGVVWSAVSDGTAGAYLSAGNEGKLFRYTAGQVKPLAQVKGGIVFAMARLGNDLIVAPSGEGKLYRVTPAGDVKPFCEIEARLVWALGVDGNDLLVAGGGEKGAVLLLAREGSSRKLADLPEETAFTALAPDGKGAWYLGTHGRGLVVRYTGVRTGDRLETLAATGFEEVHAIALNGGRVFAGATSGVSNRFATGSLERREGYLAEPGTQTKSAVIRIDRDGVPQTLWQSTQSQIFALAAWNGHLLVGTGNRSRLFSVPLSDAERAENPFAALQDLGAAQATAFLPAGSDLMVVASNPAELHLINQVQATEGTVESRILKGAPLADWGRAYVESLTPQGTSVDFQVRTGATETPDSTWTPWTPPLVGGERPNLPPARNAQFRLRLSSTRGGATPTVESVRIHWANRNLAPLWEGVEIMPPGLVITRTAPPDDIGIERVPLETQKLIPALGYAGSEKRSFRRGAQAFMFKVADPNGDPLAFAIRLLPEAGGAPIPLEKAWKERFFTFDTLPVPDGKYRLEVTASDAPGVPLNAALEATWRTGAFIIDHTPPVISEVSAVQDGDRVRVRFSARDATSVLKEAAVSADGDSWVQVAPESRIFDTQEATFDVTLPRDRVRGNRVLVRVTDLCNNEQTASAAIGEPKRK
ncbi:SMP-30/gluconolactonase/LRE family protein [Mesoterricola sediminis]|uniref:WD40 repeat domain-containing protein n=1 Tax=Mesoterricola sediminis TaxID=2927980 RepID=A0AA48GWW9_9BACT|nr:hypothetical protein [Mesoterricola sediminis]BDU77774.1 hypothetical protein METESE_27320 [Mesoterricola sediminis]